MGEIRFNKNFLGCSAVNPKDKTAFEKMILVGNTSTNLIITNAFNQAFDYADASNFITQTNKLLPAIQPNYDKRNLNITFDSSNIYLPTIPNAANITDGLTTTRITKDGRFQIAHSGLQNILVNTDELTGKEWQDSTVQAQPDFYMNYLNKIPGSSYLPGSISKPKSISTKDIIGGGVRFLDPWPHENWPNFSPTNPWAPDPYTTKGPVKLSATKYNQAILVSPGNRSVGNAYGVIPRALITVNPYDSSLILAVQQENINNKSNIEFGPWVVAPVRIPADRKALVAFPVSNDVINTLNDINAVNQNQKTFEDWMKSFKDNKKWMLDSEHSLITVDPSKPGQQSKLNTQKTNWAVFGIEGSDKAIVMRSLYDHSDQFQIFVRKPENGDKAEYIELEYTGPKVKFGEKSTVVVKWEFPSLENLTSGKLKKFGETGNLDQEIKMVSLILKDRIKKPIN